jgi:hypothetical protein
MSQDSVFIFPATLNNKEVFAAAGVTPNTHPDVKSEYVYTARDSVEAFTTMREYALRHGINVPDYSLVDKAAAQQKFSAAGFSVLSTAAISSRSDIEAFPADRLILKPAVSANSRATGNSLASALYVIKTKAELLNILDELSAFSDPSLLADNPIIAQQVADGDGENFEALILSGVVNGAGEVWHLAPIELSQQYNDAGRNAKTVWSSENSSPETAQLQQCVERLLADAGSVNCFYQLQFLRSNGVWVPHDFQYRMTYYVDFGLEQVGFVEYKMDIIKFAFDQSAQTPAQPQAFGLKLSAPRTGRDKKVFVQGTSKAEVLAKLGRL